MAALPKGCRLRPLNSTVLRGPSINKAFFFILSAQLFASTVFHSRLGLISFVKIYGLLQPCLTTGAVLIIASACVFSIIISFTTVFIQYFLVFWFCLWFYSTIDLRLLILQCIRFIFYYFVLLNARLFILDFIRLILPSISVTVSNFFYHWYFSSYYNTYYYYYYEDSDNYYYFLCANSFEHLIYLIFFSLLQTFFFPTSITSII